jgi:hypothetical protein
MQPISHACTCRERSASRLGTSAAPPTPPARTVQSTARRSRRTFGSRRASMQVRCHRLPCAPSKSDCHVAQSPRRSPADEPTHWAALLRGRDRRQQRPQEHRRSQLRAQPHAQPHSGPRQLGPQRKPTARREEFRQAFFLQGENIGSFPHQALFRIKRKIRQEAILNASGAGRIASALDRAPAVARLGPHHKAAATPAPQGQARRPPALRCAARLRRQNAPSS